MFRTLLFVHLCAASVCSYGQVKDTFEVYFPVNKATLSKAAEDYIDQLIFKDTLVHGDKLIVLGYTDYTGSNGYNDSLSVRRAEHVCAYLVSSGFGREDIKMLMGKGKVERQHEAGTDGYAADRKVQIIIDRSKPETIVKKQPAPVQPRMAVLPMERVDVTKLKVNQAFALRHIYFEPGLAFLLPESYTDLEHLLAFLEEHTSVRIRIEGHVCCLGYTDGQVVHDDGGLFEERALAVYRYLVQKGIAPGRLEYAGLGDSNPVSRYEATEDEKQSNRRVEIRLLSK